LKEFSQFLSISDDAILSYIFTNYDDMAHGHCMFSGQGFSTDFWCLLFSLVQHWILFTGFAGELCNYYTDFPADCKSILSKGMLCICLRFWNLLKTKLHVCYPWLHVCCYMVNVCWQNCRSQMVILSEIR